MFQNKIKTYFFEKVQFFSNLQNLFWFNLKISSFKSLVLSCKAHYNYLPVVPLTREESSIRVLLDLSLYNITLTPILREEIIVTQKNDEGMAHIRRIMQEGDPKVDCFHEDAEGTLWFKNRLIVPKKEALKKKILDEAHTSRYSIHPFSTKMYHDMREQFWWT
jgi:hypothetical protein